MCHLATLALILTATNVNAEPDSWRVRDTALEATAVTLLVADFLQTRQIVRDGLDGSGPGEANVMIRATNPEFYFGVATLGHVVVARLLPHGWREAWQGVTIGAEINAISVNLDAGYGFRW